MMNLKVLLDRPIEANWPYLRIAATCIKVRQNGCVVSVAVIVAVGANVNGRGEIKRRTQIVGNFPDDAAIVRLVGAVLLQQNDK